MVRLLIVIILLLLIALSAAAQSRFTVQLGPTNTGSGLTIPSLGDGQNLPATLGGRECRVTNRQVGASFLYVDVADSFPLGKAVYITFDYFDQRGRIELHYDSGEGDLAYRQAPGAFDQSGTGQWRTATFTLRNPQFRNRENGGTDFRIYSSGQLAVSQITVSTEPPAGYTPPVDPAEEFARREPAVVDPRIEVIQQWQVHEPVPASYLLDQSYETAKKIGVTSLQSYVGWAQLEPEQGVITYETYDPVVSQLTKHGLKWLPFLIMGPYISTPKWWAPEYGVDAVCLEHDTPIRIQSIWNPNLKAGVRRFLELFKTHYPSEVIEALNLGISGNWGESIYPVGGGFDMQGVHTHVGWWCGDVYARADFQRWLEAKYGAIDKLNAAWGSSFMDFGEAQPIVPKDSTPARQVKDQADWYLESMTDYAEFWVKTARELYPDLPIYLCTGGSGNPLLGADFAAQARMCAKYDAGIRITNMNDDMANGFAITRMVSSACRLYGGYYTTEPAGANTPKGVAGRVFDLVAGGARGVYFKRLLQAPPEPGPNGITFMDNAHFALPNAPQLTAAALMPNTSIDLSPGTTDAFLDRAAKLRDALNFEFVDENMISDGLLERFKAVVVLAGDKLEASTLTRLEAWVKAGGVLLLPVDLTPLKDVEGRAAEWTSAKPYAGPPLFAVEFDEGAPKGLSVDIGGEDEGVLTSFWHGAEGRGADPTPKQPDPTFRWTGGDSSLSLPLPAGGPLKLTVQLSVPAQVAEGARLLVNGTPLVSLSAGDDQKVEVAIPPELVANRATLSLTFESKTFVPGPNDPRSLGLQVRSVDLFTEGTDPSELVAASMLKPHLAINEAAVLANLPQPLGKGFVVVWPDNWESYQEALNVLLHTAKGPWAQLSEPLDGVFDNVLACRAGKQVYYLNNGDELVSRTTPWGAPLTIEPRTIQVVEGE